MAIFTKAMIGLAHAREAQIDTIALEETVETEMTKTVASLGKIDETEMMDVEQVEGQRERPYPLSLRMSVIAAQFLFINLLIVLGPKNW